MANVLSRARHWPLLLSASIAQGQRCDL